MHTKITYESLDQAKSAVESGKRVFWTNYGYQVKQDKSGEWLVACFSGVCYALEQGHLKDLYSDEP